MSDTIVIYHGGCRDGFCAAWVYSKYRFIENERLNSFNESHNILNVEYFSGIYGQEPPDVTGKDVIIVDFCYPLEVMIRIVQQCKSLIWLDHHKTAIQVANWFEECKYDIVKYVFDNNRSGAGIAWDYFFSNEKRPWIVDYVEDRDLWRKALDESDIVNAWIACLKFDFLIWDAQLDVKLQIAIERGLTAILKTDQYVTEVCKNAYFVDVYNPDYYKNDFVGQVKWSHIPVVNICQVDCSEVLHELCKLYPESPFSMYWFRRPDGMYQYGLRSIGDFDVSVVAKLFGGGGHKNAAGFQFKYLLEELQ